MFNFRVELENEIRPDCRRRRIYVTSATMSRETKVERDREKEKGKEREKVRLTVNPVADNCKRYPRSLTRTKRPAHFPLTDRARVRSLVRFYAFSRDHPRGRTRKAAITCPVITKVD